MEFSVAELLAGDVLSDRIHRMLGPATEELGSLGSWAWGPTTGEVAWSDNLFRLLGLEPHNEPPLDEAFMALVHPDDRPEVGRTTRRYKEGRGIPGRYRMIRSDGEVRFWDSVPLIVIERGPSPVVVGCTRDVTDSALAERDVGARLAVSRALERWEGLEASAEPLLFELGRTLGMERGVLWTPSGVSLEARVVWSSRPSQALLVQLAHLQGGARDGFAVHAWHNAQPVYATGVLPESTTQTWSRARGEILRSVVALPVVSRAEVLAVVEFASAFPFRVSELLHSTLVGLGHELGEFFSHRRADLRPPVLTPRERQVLELASNGSNGPEIAHRLYVSRTTVKSHFDHIFAKYGVRDRAAAVAQALREGEIR
jgi:DNA-binding CsgD family transcriptional regulator